MKSESLKRNEKGPWKPYNWLSSIQRAEAFHDSI